MPWRRWTFLVVAIALVTSVRADDDPIEARMRADITFLASDACEGRGIETAGINLAADHIARTFEKSGLKPAGVKGSWFQPFNVYGAPKLTTPGVLTLTGPLGQIIQLKAGDDFQVMGFSGSGTVVRPVVFAGYGVTAKEADYDDYRGLDVADKVVIVVRKTPRYNNADLPFDGPRKDEHAPFDRKQALAEINRAAAVIHVNDLSEAASGDKLLPFNPSMGLSPSSIPAVQMRRSLLDMMLQSSLDTSLKSIEQAIDRDLKPRSARLSGWTATLKTELARTVIPVKNVVGVLEGAGPLANETIIIGAHYDHLGYGGRGSRTKTAGAPKEIHHGADDNGSGTTAVLELSRRFGAMKGRQGRRLVFMTYSAEETGLLGSQHYCNKEPLFPLADTAAMVNLDMVGRLRPDKDTKLERLIVEGIGTAKSFEQLVDKHNPGFTFAKRKGGTGPSDHDSFYRKKIPVLFFWTDVHEDYHRPTDTADRINVAGMRKITDFAEKVVAQLAVESQRPEYVQVASTMSMGSTKGPRLGIMPNYDEDKKGVLVGGLTDGGAAAKGGLKANDLIVEIGGRPVTNINTYMAIMGQQKAGQALDVVVERDGKKLKLKVTPQ